jgi:trehalose 6-phosphate synthase/phosphatase
MIMLILRFILPLLLALSTLAIVVTPLTENFVAKWFRRDVELRSQLIFQSVEYTLIEFLSERRKQADYQKIFNKIAQDERVLGLGLCSANNEFIGKSSQLPPTITCPEKLDQQEFIVQEKDKSGNLIGSFPLEVDGKKFSFIVLHDLTFSVKRVHKARSYLIIFLIIISVTAAVVTILTARITLRSWLSRFRISLANPEASISKSNLPREFMPVAQEIRKMLREMTPGAYQLENIKIEWTPQNLKKLLEAELPDSEVIIVSNREPYIHNKINGNISVQRPASGVVNALEPILRACGGTWIAHGSGSADKEIVDSSNCIQVPPEHPEYTLRRVWLSEEEENGYYYGLANEGLWPLCHITFVRPNFRESDWQIYKNVNRKFADVIISQAKTQNPIILVQDYHFAMLPRYVREKLPNATIITFWHIPWPNPEVFGICPWREEILSGLLGSSVIGFHTQFHCNNFMDTVDRFLESHIKRDQSIVSAGDHKTLIRPYPISIAWPPERMEHVSPADICRKNICKAFKLADNMLLGVGIERFDYTKGIIDRFLAIRELLKHYPQWRGKFTFIQAAAPTRSSLPAYEAVQQEAYELVNSINQEFGNDHYKPILLVVRHHEPEEVFEIFRAADFCIVSSLHDGMNLVAKEFVASREDEKGVLILSTFAGASKELLEAILVNPYDARAMAEAMHKALIMPEVEKTERMRLMREMVRDNNVYYWAARMLLDAAHLRKRAHIESLITESAN